MLTRSPHRFEAAIEGGPAHASIGAEVELARVISAVRLDVGPDPQFVAALRERLLDEPDRPASVVPRPHRLGVARPLRVTGAVVGLAVISIIWWSSRPGSRASTRPAAVPRGHGDACVSRPH